MAQLFWRNKMVSEKVLEALKPPTYEKINELRIAAEKENAALKAELIKTKHEQQLLNERLEKEINDQAKRKVLLCVNTKMLSNRNEIKEFLAQRYGHLRGAIKESIDSLLY